MNKLLIAILLALIAFSTSLKFQGHDCQVAPTQQPGGSHLGARIHDCQVAPDTRPAHQKA